MSMCGLLPRRTGIWTTTSERVSFERICITRLNVIPVILPSLRERQEDIPELLQFYLERHAHHDQVSHFDGALTDALCHYAWPGKHPGISESGSPTLLLFPPDKILVWHESPHRYYRQALLNMAPVVRLDLIGSLRNRAS